MSNGPTPLRPNAGRGRHVLRLLLETDWVHRRVERVEFLDDRTIRRHVSIDMTLPKGDRTASADGLVPLTVLRKQPLIDFDVRDRGGRSLPVLTTEQNASISFDALAAAVSGVLRAIGRSGAGPDLLADVWTITHGEPSHARRIVDQWIEADDVRATLMRYETSEGRAELGELLYLFAENFLLLAKMEEQDAERTVLKFSYVEPFPAEDVDRLLDADELEDALRGEDTSVWTRVSSFLYRIGARISWLAEPVTFDVYGIGRGGTYHFEAWAPRGLKMVGGLGYAFYGRGGSDDAIANVRVTPGYLHAHFAGVKRESRGLVVAFFRPERLGLLRSGTFVGLLTAALLALFAPFLNELEKPGASPSALLLVIPGLVSAYISRPGENPMASYMLFWLRFLVSLTALSAYAGAVFLVLRKGDVGTPWPWWGLVCLAGASCLVLFGAYLRANSGVR